MLIAFIRHSKPDLIVGEPAATWALSAEGRDRAVQLSERLRGSLPGEGASAFASTEVKAVQTAELLGLGPVTADERFGEVRKPWYNKAADHEAAVSEFLTGADHNEWERRADALDRFGAGVADLGDVPAVVTTHGTVLALWLSEQIPGFEPVPFWLSLAMPDAWIFETERKTTVRLA